MPRLLSRSVRPVASALTLLVITNAASAQWGPFGSACDCQPAIAPTAAGPIYSHTAMANPCLTQSVALNPCPQIQPVQETVLRDVPVTEYRKETRTVKRPVVKTVYVDKPVTVYRQNYVDKTVEIPSVEYQTVTECKPVTVNRSYWRTVQQPVQKMTPCAYDPRPTLTGWFNRQSYGLRMAFTPNYIRRREFVPNVVAYNVPVQRTVAVPTTRQVTYKVSQLEPYETTQRVARLETQYVEEEVTAYVPYTTTKTVAVGTRTRYAVVEPFGASSTTTASGPTPDRHAEAEPIRPKKQTSTNTPGGVQLNSYERPDSSPDDFPAPREPAPFHGFDEQGNVRPTPADADADVAGWRPSGERGSTLNRANSPSLPIVAAK